MKRREADVSKADGPAGDDPKRDRKKDPQGDGQEGDGQGEAQDDPFAGLVLDDDFIAGATAYEAPARTRAAVARYGTTQDPSQPGPVLGSPRLRRRKLFRPRAIIPVAIVLVVLVGAGYAVFRPVDEPSGDAGPVATKQPTTSPDDRVTLTDQHYTRGHCYTWAQEVEHTKAEDVPCAEPHLFEAVEKTNIAAGFSPASEFPTDAEWDDITKRFCLSIVEDFLGKTLDPHGRFSAGAIRPIRSGWDIGDREIVCGMIAAATSPDPDPDQLVAFTGRVGESDQALVYPEGRCLELTETEVTGPVSCERRHQAESTGPATLSDTADGAPPSDATLAEKAGPLCLDAATRFLGRQPEDGMRIAWLGGAPESWEAGTRTLSCMIEFVDEAGRLTGVTEALRRGPDGADTFNA